MTSHFKQMCYCSTHMYQYLNVRVLQFYYFQHLGFNVYGGLDRQCIQCLYQLIRTLVEAPIVLYILVNIPMPGSYMQVQYSFIAVVVWYCYIHNTYGFVSQYQGQSSWFISIPETAYTHYKDMTMHLTYRKQSAFVAFSKNIFFIV